ncbi:cell filamentation protein Fic [Eikenella sp. NML080894]|uniref:Fic family protein n=1 Tax=Eikenella sp. NML080894 TaxID=1795830 RepID=UPI0007E071DF|nr:Fic family protein [Eikenella sp. NML080894]OAM35544.1 cell filamentation protein Fic [Eikenella sp. NML080894]
MAPSFKHFDLQLINPSFDSELVDVLNELEVLRHLQLQGDVPPLIFLQLKAVFHMLESLGSARIEGNHTTLADYVESRLDSVSLPEDQLSEIRNIETAMQYIDDHLQAGDMISEHFIRELHVLAVKNLEREGDKTPGAYRQIPVSISQSFHLPPDQLLVPDYMKELVKFINQQDKPKYDLMKIALTHHRFGWIHPFCNGNGRTVRLLTYALLVKYGFNVKVGGRVLNPTAVFCNDRSQYYAMLGAADSGKPQDLEQWCIYVLSGISQELKKVDQLTQFSFLSERILYPALRYSIDRKHITVEEEQILRMLIKKGEIKAGDLKVLFPSMSPNQRTYQIKKLVDKKFISPKGKGLRSYEPNFINSYLIRGIISSLKEQGFIGGID